MPDEETGGGASQSTDPAAGTSAATDVSLREFVAQHNSWLWRFMEERDRRYLEVQRERDKAEVIARETQTYKDLKANELREQISEERGRYVTQTELAGAISEIKAILTPVTEYVAGQQGSRQGAFDQRQLVGYAVGLVATLTAVYFAFN